VIDGTALPPSRLRASVVRLVYEITVVGCVEIDLDIASELAIFVTDHRRAAREGNFRYFRNRDLGARRCSDQYWATFFHVVAKITLRRPPRRAQGAGWSGARPPVYVNNPFFSFYDLGLRLH
jgi:hypothetical protein